MMNDFVADENGEFEIHIIDYITKQKIGSVTIKNFEPNHPIGYNLIKGKYK